MRPLAFLLLVVSQHVGICYAAAGDPSPQTALVPSRTVPGTLATITAPPQTHADLIKRAPFTCGFVSGNPSSALTCPSGYTCHETSGVGILRFTCCNQVNCLDDYSLCNDWGSSGCAQVPLDAALCSSIYGSILTWYISLQDLSKLAWLTRGSSEAAPKCRQYVRSSSLGDHPAYVSLTCGLEARDIPVLVTATGTGTTDKATPTGSAAGQTTAASDLINSILNAGSTSATSGSTTDTTTATKTASDTAQKSGLSTKAIAAIAVGGVIVIAIVLAITFVCWRYHQNQGERVRRGLTRRNIARQDGHTVVTDPTSRVTAFLRSGPRGDPNMPPAQSMSMAGSVR
ncbi:hypothetical protein CAC42_5987 [Sphaceloma murrayae]|uniref:Transmembrane protein n=1 Tax=Sphaceloma murrayae TaxID=2082308 RepID=A0A2K1QZR8_9PEZI|nr:hypothetical protein CAC42_5987 [Sphaceloma murrayae]